jgi:hypothetical protein
MKLRRILGTVAVMALAATSLTLATGATASAAGRPNALVVTGPCGDLLTFVERVAGTLIIDIVVPSADSTEVWHLNAKEQLLNPVTGGRVGAPINLVPSPLPDLAFSQVEGGYDTTANFVDNPGFTYEFSYTATRTVPSAQVCQSIGFFTDPGNGVRGPAGQNPTGYPNSAPVPTGNNEALHGSHVASIQFDQEMLGTTQGAPAANRFSVTVNGVARAVTGVSVADDSPPNKAVANLTLAGATLGAAANVQVTYHPPLNNTDPQFQDITEVAPGQTVPPGLDAASFGPVTIPIL